MVSLAGGGGVTASLYHPCIHIHDSLKRGGSDTRRYSTEAPASAALHRWPPCRISRIWRLRCRTDICPHPTAVPITLIYLRQRDDSYLVRSTPDGLIISAVAWVPPYVALRTGGPCCSRFAVSIGESDTFFKVVCVFLSRCPPETSQEQVLVHIMVCIPYQHVPV